MNILRMHYAMIHSLLLDEVFLCRIRKAELYIGGKYKGRHY